MTGDNADGTALVIALVIGFIASLGVANMVGEGGSTQTRGQSWASIAVGVIVAFIAFAGARALLR